MVVVAESGLAQIGYNGAGGGDIDVLATVNVLVATAIGNTAQIGNGGRNVVGTIGGDISVTTNDGGEVLLEAASADFENRGIATIGNLGSGNSSEGGDITIDTGPTGTFAAAASGLWDFAKVGNWNVGSSTGTASGDIQIDTGVLEIFAGVQDADGSLNFAGIGNGGFTSGVNLGGLSGDITINALTIALDAEGDTSGNNSAEARIGNLGDGPVTGDINITAASDLTIVSNGTTVASIGNVSAPSDSNFNPLQGEYTGNLVIQSGGNISLIAENLGSARIESGGLTSGTVSVTATGNILLSADTTPDFAGSAFIGTFVSGNGGGDITVTSAHGNITLDENGAQNDSGGGNAQIGNAQEGLAGQVGGNVTVTAADAELGGVVLSGQDGQVLVGNSGSEGSSVSGDITVSTANALNLAGKQTLIGNFNPGGPISGSVTIDAAEIVGDPGATILNELTIGDFALNLTGSAALVLPIPVIYSSPYALTISNGGDIVFDASLQNAGAGNITIASRGNVTIGGQEALGSVAVGSFGGTTTITGTNIIVEADNGTAQIGYDGAGTGAINVAALNNVSVLANTSGTWAQIGNGAYAFTGNAGGNISVSAGGALEVLTNASGYAQIGNGGLGQTGNSSGNISVSAGSILIEADGPNSAAHIGNATLTGNSSGNLSIATGAGDIAVIAGDASASLAAIGNGLYNEDGTASGNIGISAVGSINIEDHSSNGVAAIGNNGVHGASGTIDISATGNLLLLTDATAEGTTSYAALGNGSNVDGTASGDISVRASNILLQTESQNAQTTGTRIGNGGYGQGTTSGNITLVANSGDVSLETTGANAYAWIGNWGATLTGNIAVQAASGGVTATGSSFVANQTGDGIAESGNVTISAQTISGLDVSIGHDLAGGDVALDILGSDPFVLAAGFVYASDHALTVTAAGDVDIEGSLKNNGNGNISITAGGNLLVGGANAHKGVAVGSFGGTTTVTAVDIVLDASNGFAQIGFAGNGATGDVNVSASHDIIMTASQNADCDACYVQIGNGGVYAAGEIGGNITVTAGNNITLTAGAEDYSYAQIGNGGDSATGSDSGSISVTAAGTLTLTGFGDYATIGNGGWGTDGDASGDITVSAHDIVMTGGNSSFGYANIGNGGQEAGNGTASGNILVAVTGDLTMTGGSGADFVQIGNGAADGSFAGTADGNITLTVGNATSLSSADSGQPWIGNFAQGGGAGDLTLVTGSLDGDSGQLGAMFAADLGTGDGSGGNVTVGLTAESNTLIAGDIEYSSANTLSILSAGNVVFLGSLQNDGTGAINVVAGWNGTTLDPRAIHLGRRVREQWRQHRHRRRSGAGQCRNRQRRRHDDARRCRCQPACQQRLRPARLSRRRQRRHRHRRLGHGCAHRRRRRRRPALRAGRQWRSRRQRQRKWRHRDHRRRRYCVDRR